MIPMPTLEASLLDTNTFGWDSAPPPGKPACPLQVLNDTRNRDRRERLTAFLGRQRCRAVAMDNMPLPARLKADRYNLLLLDVQLEPLGGLEVLRRVRTQSDIPVIMMSDGPRDDYDRVMGLEMGADDFVDEPLNPRELFARGRAILRRHAAAQENEADQHGGYAFNGWELRRRTRTVTDSQGRPVALSKNDYALLLAFLAAPRRSLSRVQLMRATRPHEDIFDRSIDVQVLRLRKKLEAAGGQAPMIKTDRNIGYIFDAEVETLF
jgi:two-component system OmpR family response regulator